jgi:hypothetical protein
MSLKHSIKTKNRETRLVELTPMKSIRHYCLECMAFSARLVKSCENCRCALHPYRTGRNPSRAAIGGNRTQNPNLRRHSRKV